MALEGSSTALRSAINAENGGADPNPDISDQAHHLLSSSVVIELDYAYRKEAGRLMANAAGYQLNAKPNGILLPTHFGHQKKHGQRHRGNHWDTYYRDVKNELLPTYKKFVKVDVCKEPAKFLGEFTDSETAVRSNIVDQTWWLYEWSEPLWEKDYRDEGVGNLKRTGPPVTAADVGREWLTSKVNAGEIIRRYTEETVKGKKKTEVNEKWYARNNYDPPTSLY